MLRQFHIEGFVNQYKLESISADGKTIVFISEAIENIPARATVQGKPIQSSTRMSLRRYLK